MTPYKPANRPLIQNRVSPEDIRTIVSTIVMQGEDQAQHDRLRHLQEELVRLTTKRDRIDPLRCTFAVDSFGREAPNGDQIAELYELTQGYYQGFYAAMGALHAFVRHFRTWQVVERQPPPDRGVERFIKWLAATRVVSALTIEELKRAREMRTLFDHPDQRRFDWGSINDQAGLIVLLIYGDRGRNDAEPDFAQHIADAPGDWQVLAPSEVSVTNAVANVLQAVAYNSHIRKFKTLEEAMASFNGSSHDACASDNADTLGDAAV